jgi:hypothetical protein
VPKAIFLNHEKVEDSVVPPEAKSLSRQRNPIPAGRESGSTFFYPAHK